MTCLYFYILCVSACVDSISAVPYITVSAPVGSTVVLPCKLTHAFNQTSAVRWSTDDDVVFERSSDGTDVGSGYEGRVDVPEDKLRKGNCSLVLKNIRLTDDGVYKTFVMEHIDTKTTKWEEVNKVELSVKVLQNISATVGSTVILPCDYRNLSIQTLHVRWYIGLQVVFERQGKESYQGEGYEGRVDVPEDELLKGTCSLVLNNVRVSDGAEYRSSMIVKHTKKPILVQKVQLLVYA
ncbi:matrix remodeling-associated protein 8-like [Clarias gariepinus]